MRVTYLTNPLLLLAVGRSGDVEAVGICVHSLRSLIAYERELFIGLFVGRLYGSHVPQRNDFGWTAVGLSFLEGHEGLGSEHEPSAK